MAEQEKGYNGWTNYETWCVNLWLTNDQGSDSYWRETASEVCRDVADNSTDTSLTQKEQAEIALADRLKDEVSEGNPLADQASMYQDMLNAALSEVNWGEIAKAFLEDADEYEELDKAAAEE